MLLSGRIVNCRANLVKKRFIPELSSIASGFATPGYWANAQCPAVVRGLNAKTLAPIPCVLALIRFELWFWV